MKIQNYNIAILLIVSFYFVSCKNTEIKETPLLHGIVKNHSNRMLYFYADGSTPTLIDSFKIAIDGTFSIQKESIDKAGFYFLKFPPNNRITLFLKPTNYIEIQFNAEELARTIKSNTSRLHNELWNIEYNNLQFANHFNLLTKELNSQIGKTKSDSILNKIALKKDSLIELYRTKTERIIKKSDSPIVTFWALQQKYGNTSLYTLENDIKLFLDNAESLVKDPILKAYFEEYDKSIVQIYANKLTVKRFNTGAAFPLLKAKNYWNEQFHISETKGQLTNVIFWDYENEASLIKLDEVRHLMKLYGNKGLKTLMVSYSKDKEEWNNTLKTLNIPYFHLIDENGTSSYDIVNMGITNLPINFLVDKEGIIIGRNIWGSELDKSIKDNLKKY